MSKEVRKEKKLSPKRDFLIKLHGAEMRKLGMMKGTYWGPIIDYDVSSQRKKFWQDFALSCKWFKYQREYDGKQLCLKIAFSFPLKSRHHFFWIYDRISSQDESKCVTTYINPMITAVCNNNLFFINTDHESDIFEYQPLDAPKDMVEKCFSKKRGNFSDQYSDWIKGKCTICNATKTTTSYHDIVMEINEEQLKLNKLVRSTNNEFKTNKHCGILQESEIFELLSKLKLLYTHLVSHSNGDDADTMFFWWQETGEINPIINPNWKKPIPGEILTKFMKASIIQPEQIPYPSDFNYNHWLKSFTIYRSGIDPVPSKPLMDLQSCLVGLYYVKSFTKTDSSIKGIEVRARSDENKTLNNPVGREIGLSTQIVERVKCQAPVPPRQNSSSTSFEKKELSQIGINHTSPQKEAQKQIPQTTPSMNSLPNKLSQTTQSSTQKPVDFTSPATQIMNQQSRNSDVKSQNVIDTSPIFQLDSERLTFLEEVMGISREEVDADVVAGMEDPFQRWKAAKMSGII